MQDTRNQDPEELYVKQDRIGASWARPAAHAHRHADRALSRQGLVWGGVQGVRLISVLGLERRVSNFLI